MSPRDPIRSLVFPAIGAMRMIRMVIGRNAAPVWRAEYPRTFCMYSDRKKNTPNIASATRSTTRFEPV